MWEFVIVEAALVLTFLKVGLFHKGKLRALRAQICISSKKRFVLGIMYPAESALCQPHRV